MQSQLCYLNYMIRTVKILISLLLVFFLHRIEAWSFVSEQYGPKAGPWWQEGITGFLSDLWMATLLSLPFWIFEYFPQKPVRHAQKFIATIWIILWGVLTAAHQNYVEFFKFQIIPFHLTYMGDNSFLSANGSSLFHPSSAVIFALAAGLAYWTWSAKSYKKKKRNVSMLMAATLLVAVSAHAANIRWRVNWFIIEPLQTNYLEALYTNWRKKPQIKRLSQEEIKVFSQVTAQNSLLYASHGGENNSFTDVIRQEVARRAKPGKPAIIGVILVESLREADTGPRSSDQTSLTPAIDSLQEQGVKFTNLYSSGPVTRGGQESVWCSTPSATDTSLMRSFPDAKVKCLPALVRSRPEFKALWLHGGDSRFDSQLLFWTHQGVSRFLTKSDFPEGTPSTGWGVSDLALFDRSAAILQESSKEPGIKLLLPMILTVSNHVPWTVPSDATLDTKNFIAAHDSHRTVKYLDESLDLFVGNLKEKNLWEQSVLIVVGDHGNLEPSWKNPYGSDTNRYQRLLSHVSMTLTGGIIEDLRDRGALAPAVSNFTAQSQIAPFLAEISGISADPAFFDRPIFETSPWPISSDLNQYLFLPTKGQSLAKEKVLSGLIPEDNTPDWIAATRYRGWLEFLYQGSQ